MTWQPVYFRLPGIPSHRFCRCAKCGRLLHATRELVAESRRRREVVCRQCMAKPRRPGPGEQRVNMLERWRKQIQEV